TSCPQSITPPHFLSVTNPQPAPSSVHVAATHAPASGKLSLAGPQLLASVPPHTSVPVHVPHFTTPPHRVSVTNPQFAFSNSQLEGQPSAEPPPTLTITRPPLLLLLPLLPLSPPLPLAPAM